LVDKEQFLIGQLSSNYIGDDGAVVGSMVYSMDSFFEGVHFEREWMSMSQIGHKAMVVNISDAIAMNASPKYALVSLSIPKDIKDIEIEELTNSLESTAREYGCEIIGGDTVGGDRLHLSITIISHSTSPLYRSGLKEGDYLAYTGVLGKSKEGLDRLFDGESIPDNSRFYRPTLRGEFIGRAREYLHSGMDISDGLYCDTNKLLEYNSLGFKPLLDIAQSVGMSGEEYEMLVAFSPQDRERVEQIASSLDMELTLFAEVSSNDNRFICKSHHF
jgi:thiamine-monophosphate kinase